MNSFLDTPVTWGNVILIFELLVIAYVVRAIVLVFYYKFFKGNKND